MITWERLYQLRDLLVKAAQSLPDRDAYYCPEFFVPWKPGTVYDMGDRIQYNGVLYKVAQYHTSQADWTPDVTPALYVEIPDPAIEFPEWKQPQGSHDAYAKGDKVSHNEKHWVSDIDANIYEPGVYGWTEV